ncbi:polysaccharide pyruvyl transferase family protein [Microbacterium esteraromaticum]|nr:polysaccharide pyruvyl transferase family protein [Microbacterium esteraromaticum]
MRALIRAGKRPEEVLRPEAALQRGRNGVFGSNVGNLLFSDAVYRTLKVPGTELIPDAFTTEREGVDTRHIARINAEMDHFVLPLANAFRPAFLPALNRLTNVIEKLDIPVTVIGVGAQLSASAGSRVEDMPTSLTAPVTRFMRAVLKSSPKVGVRGEFTREYLEALGFGSQDVEVIGCPSLLDRAEYRVAKRVAELSAESMIAFNAVPSLDLMGDVLNAHRERFPNTYYVQQEHRELALLMWGQPIEGKLARAFPRTVDHPNYTRDLLRFFVDPAAWRDFLARCDFSFGNRIHGNIAALTAGTPAFLLAHDSRTRELADYHRIPFTAMPAVAEEIRVEELYENADYGAFHAVQPENLSRYVSFLDAAGLPSVHVPGNENPEYDEVVNSAPTGQPVRSLAVEESSVFVSRLNWLWQDIDVDQFRTAYSYAPPFVPSDDISVGNVEAASLLRKAPRHFASMERQIDDVRRTVEALRAEVKEVRRWSTRPMAAIPEGSLIRRAARRLRAMLRSTK